MSRTKLNNLRRCGDCQFWLDDDEDAYTLDLEGRHYQGRHSEVCGPDPESIAANEPLLEGGESDD